jgi:hypothetical protein
MAEVEELNREFARLHKGPMRPDQSSALAAPAVPVEQTKMVATDDLQQSSVLAGFDDRVRTISLMQLEPDWKNSQVTYWLVGPITIQNLRDVAVSLDGYLEASHSRGPIQFNVEGTVFKHWEATMQLTYQASSPQLILPIYVPPHSSFRGIALIRFPGSELGGFGRFREADQTIRFVLTLCASPLFWSTPLRLPYEWNPQPLPEFNPKKLKF